MKPMLRLTYLDMNAEELQALVRKLRKERTTLKRTIKSNEELLISAGDCIKGQAKRINDLTAHVTWARQIGSRLTDIVGGLASSGYPITPGTMGGTLKEFSEQLRKMK